jgi:hypothetical protein
MQCSVDVKVTCVLSRMFHSAGAIVCEISSSGLHGVFLFSFPSAASNGNHDKFVPCHNWVHTKARRLTCAAVVRISCHAWSVSRARALVILSCLAAAVSSILQSSPTFHHLELRDSRVRMKQGNVIAKTLTHELLPVARCQSGGCQVCPLHE